MQKIVCIPITQIDAKLNPLLEEGWLILAETFRVVPQVVRGMNGQNEVKQASMNYIIAVMQKA